jgi:hypothetical protein
MLVKEFSMTNQFDTREAARFLRTLRVTTQTALAQEDLRRGRALGRPTTAFQALAAKGPGEWRFPDSGLMSSDGLVLAKLSHEPGGAHVMELQAQGLVGLSAYANRAARVRFGASLSADGMFDRDGRLHLVFEAATISDADLSAFELQLLDGAL